MTVKEIVLEYLDKHNLDGLYNSDGECACLKNDLAPCGQMDTDCSVGLKQDCNDDDYAYWGHDIGFRVIDPNDIEEAK